MSTTTFEGSTRTLSFLSDFGAVGEAEELAERLAREAGLHEDAAAEVAMCTREAVINAMLHGNGSDPALSVTVTYTTTPETFTVAIADQGRGFDVAAVPDPLKPENLLRSSGRGLLMMRSYMDEVHFRKLPRGTEVIMVRHRHADHKETA